MRWVFITLLVLLYTSCNHRNYAPEPRHTISTPQYTSNCNIPGGQIILEGHYQKKNVYVQNPFAYCTDTSTRYCAFEVVINDTITIPADTIASSAFEIPLTHFGFQEGDSVRIVIKHYSDCAPKVLNPEVH